MGRSEGSQLDWQCGFKQEYSGFKAGGKNARSCVFQGRLVGGEKGFGYLMVAWMPLGEVKRKSVFTKRFYWDGALFFSPTYPSPSGIVRINDYRVKERLIFPVFSSMCVGKIF